MRPGFGAPPSAPFRYCASATAFAFPAQAGYLAQHRVVQSVLCTVCCLFVTGWRTRSRCSTSRSQSTATQTHSPSSTRLRRHSRTRGRPSTSTWTSQTKKRYACPTHAHLCPSVANMATLTGNRAPMAAACLTNPSLQSILIMARLP